jgi:hypothetical protein
MWSVWNDGGAIVPEITYVRTPVAAFQWARAIYCRQQVNTNRSYQQSCNWHSSSWEKGTWSYLITSVFGSNSPQFRVIAAITFIQQLNHDRSFTPAGLRSFPWQPTSSFKISTMSSEETPLLIDQRNHNAVYNRFTRRQKRVIVAVVSWAGLLPRKYPISSFFEVTIIKYNFTAAVFVSGSFIPTIPQVAYDLDSSGPVIR